MYVSWSTSELRARLAQLNWFKPSSKIFYWPFQGGTSFVDLLCFSVLCLLCLCVRLFYVLCGHLLGKGWPLGSRLWRLTVSLSLSYWYPCSGVVLDCINSWSLHLFFTMLKEPMLVQNICSDASRVQDCWNLEKTWVRTKNICPVPKCYIFK